MNWTNDLIQHLENEIKMAPHGQKRKVADELAESIGCSVATLYRHVDITGGQQRAPREPEVPSWVIDLVAQAKAEPAMMGVNAREMNTGDAIAALEDANLIEPGTLTVSTADRRLRERGFNQPRSYTRHEDDFVNQVHMMDFSRSEYFEVADHDGDDWVLKVDGRNGQWNYKNKPKAERKRLWVASYLDTFSRAWVVRYHVSTGENLPMVTDFLRFVWQREDSTHPLRHLPVDYIKLDQGAIGKSTAFRRGMEDRLGVRVELAAAKNDTLADHQSQGKIERRFSILWQKELKWAFVLKKREQQAISLSDLNTLAHDFCTRRMGKKHPLRDASIKQVYQTGLRLHEQRTLSPAVDLYTLFYAEDSRTVSATNDIQIDNQLYKVPEGYTMQRIYYIQTPDGRMKGMSPDKRDTFELVPFDAAAATGQKMHDPTYKELMAKKGLELDGNRVPLTEGDEAGLPPNVHTLQPEETEETPETPFSAQPREDVFEDWDQAKVYICECFNCRWTDLADRTQQLFRDLFEIKKLDKQAVEELSETAS